MFDCAVRIVAARWLSVLAWFVGASWMVNTICIDGSVWRACVLLAWIYLPGVLASHQPGIRALYAAGIILGILLCEFRHLGIARHACGLTAAAYVLSVIHSGRRHWRWQSLWESGLLVALAGFLWMLTEGYSSDLPIRQARDLQFAFGICGGWVCVTGLLVCLSDLCVQAPAKLARWTYPDPTLPESQSELNASCDR